MPESLIKVPCFKLFLNGKELTYEIMKDVLELIVEEEINLPVMFRIKFNIVDTEKGKWQGVNLKMFKPGDVIKVLMGLDKSVKIMTGEITSLDVTFGEYSFMEIRGYDRLHRLRFGTKKKSFKDMTDSDIASSIAQDAGLTIQAEATNTVFPYLFQNNQSDYDFLLGRAKRIGYEMFVDDKKLIFRKSQQDKSPGITLDYGLDIEDFSVHVQTLTQGSTVEFRGWDVKKKKEIISKATAGSETTKMTGKESGFELSKKAFGKSDVVLVDDMIIDSSHADTLAKAKYNSLLKEFIKGEGRCSGNPDIRAGKTIGIRGIGERFSGTYYVVATVHTINEEGYITTFKLRRTGI